MEYKFCVHPMKAAVSAVTACCLALISDCLIYLDRFGSAAIFLGLAAVFGYLAGVNGATVHIDDTRVWRTLLGIHMGQIRWDDVAEVVVTGTRVFNQKNPEKTGFLYIYFSPQPLTEADRFNIRLL